MDTIPNDDNSGIDYFSGLDDSYYADPSLVPLSLSLQATTLDDAKRELFQILLHWISSITHRRRINPVKRTGKPETPLQVSWHILDPSPVVSVASSFYASYTRSASNQQDQTVNDETYFLYFSDFWQRYPCDHDTTYPPLRTIFTHGTCHPLRPTKPAPGSTLYTRFIPSLGTSFSLQVVDIDKHIEDCSTWHNSDRVNAFWGERGTESQHRQYLSRQESDDHVTPVMGYFGTQAFGYFELYWAKEDSVGPYAAATDWDAGFHALVGNEAHRGPEKVRVWISAITHYLFLRDIRTQRVMLEPRVDNAKFIKYLTQHGYSVEKEFNFPHKRAALVSVSREKFFEVQGVET